MFAPRELHTTHALVHHVRSQAGTSARPAAPSRQVVVPTPTSETTKAARFEIARTAMGSRTAEMPRGGRERATVKRTTPTTVTKTKRITPPTTTPGRGRGRAKSAVTRSHGARSQRHHRFGLGSCQKSLPRLATTAISRFRQGKARARGGGYNAFLRICVQRAETPSATCFFDVL